MIEWVKERLYQWIMQSRINARMERHAREHGLFIDAMERATATRRANCTHLKGGWVRLTDSSQGLGEALSKGDANQYAVFKHMMPNGDVWVRCIRCGKQWKPPIRSEYKTDRAYYQAVEEYEAAKLFQTNNHMSGSIQWKFAYKGSVDAGTEYVRKQLANS